MPSAAPVQSVDVMSVGCLSLRDPQRSQDSFKLALELGINAVWIGSDPVEGRAPSHIVYGPLWAMMQEAGVPVTLHIGNVETTKPKDLPVVHHTIERWLTCMIYDGVLERFPELDRFYSKNFEDYLGL